MHTPTFLLLFFTLLALFTPIKSQSAQHPLANHISSACLTNLQPSTLPELLPAIQEAAAANGVTNFTEAFKSLVIGSQPAWFSNLPQNYQSQLSAFRHDIVQIKDDAIKNHTDLCSSEPTNEKCGAITSTSSVTSLGLSATSESLVTGTVVLTITSAGNYGSASATGSTIRKSSTSTETASATGTTVASLGFMVGPSLGKVALCMLASISIVVLS